MDRPAVRRALEAYHKTEDPAAALAKLAELETLPPALKKQLKLKPGAPPLDFAKERAMQHYKLGCALYCKADVEYWQHRDPSAIPIQSEYADWSTATNAALLRARRLGPPKITGRASVPDFAPARATFEYLITIAPRGLDTNARKVLARIALRENKPHEAIRWCMELISVDRLHEVDVASQMAWACQQLSDSKGLVKWLTLRKGPTDKGYLAELQGDDAAAIRYHLEALATALSEVGVSVTTLWHAYSRLRLRHMEARLGKAAIARVKKSLVDEHEGGKIKIASVADFYARFADIAAMIRKREKITKAPQPMSEAAIAKLRLRTSRTSATPTIPVPKSVATILRVDRDFRLWRHAEPLLSHLKIVNVEKLVRDALRGEDTGLGPLAKLPASVPVWTDDPAMPACISLASPGDQELFLYMGVPDADGEYPLARFDDAPELWISDASLAHYILEAAGSVVESKLDLAKAKKQAQKRNAQFREGFSEHPKVAAVLARF